jgi:hypothetical protein
MFTIADIGKVPDASVLDVVSITETSDRMIALVTASGNYGLIEVVRNGNGPAVMLRFRSSSSNVFNPLSSWDCRDGG